MLIHFHLQFNEAFYNIPLDLKWYQSIPQASFIFRTLFVSDFFHKFFIKSLYFVVIVDRVSFRSFFWAIPSSSELIFFDRALFRALWAPFFIPKMATNHDLPIPTANPTFVAVNTDPYANPLYLHAADNSGVYLVSDKLKNKQFSVHFYHDFCFIQDHIQEWMIGQGDRFNDLYLLSQSDFSHNHVSLMVASAELWH